MSSVWRYLGIGCAVAIGGMFAAEISGSVFNGMDYGSACTVGLGMYLCVVVVTCTGVIISKITSKSGEDAKIEARPEEKES